LPNDELAIMMVSPLSESALYLNITNGTITTEKTSNFSSYKEKDLIIFTAEVAYDFGFKEGYFLYDRFLRYMMQERYSY
jgi:hypothetical protein